MAVGGSKPSGNKHSTPIQTGTETNPASCTIGTRSPSPMESSQGEVLNMHPKQGLRLKNE